jgi:hypothetical protein
MDTARIDALTADEVQDALLLVGAFESTNMTVAEADEWRRRVLARAAFLDLSPDVVPSDESL